MTILFLSTSANKLSVVDVDNDTGTFMRTVETIDPIVDPLPLMENGQPVPSTGWKAPVTEWIERHPNFDLLYAFTSFLDGAKAIVTTFRILDSGALTKLGQIGTGGFQATHACFTPDQSHLVVAHYIGGAVSFFDCSQDETLQEPVMILQTPELEPGTRSNQLSAPLPSTHSVQYSPNSKYLLTTDVSAQGRVWTYNVDPHGLPVQDTPLYNFRPTFCSKVITWLSWILLKAMGAHEYRIRRACVHPNGRYVYLLIEFNLMLQVYEIDDKGRIMGNCLQEVATVDPAFLSKSYFGNSKWTGVAINSAAELHVTESELLVSNRSLRLQRLGQGEVGIRIFAMEDEGAKLVPKQVLPTVGPVRHFWANKECTKMHAGIENGSSTKVVETFGRPSINEAFQKLGEANVEMDVLCIASK